MESVNHPITIVGCGPGGADEITLSGLRAIEQARVLVGSRRLLETFGRPGQPTITVTGDIDAALEAMEGPARSGGVVVLVSGDPGISSLAQPVVKRFGRNHCHIIPGISAVQTAFARLGLDWLDARLVSAHGRVPETAFAELAACDKIAVLAGTAQAMQWAADLAECLGRHDVYVCQDLTLSTERIRRAGPSELRIIPPLGRTMILFIKKGRLS
jgi:cobalt-precorrin-7 (C5)-methyltransferase